MVKINNDNKSDCKDEMFFEKYSPKMLNVAMKPARAEGAAKPVVKINTQEKIIIATTLTNLDFSLFRKYQISEITKTIFAPESTSI